MSVCFVIAMGLLLLRGYAAIALTGLVLLPLYWLRSDRQPRVGAQIFWQQGSWWLIHNGKRYDFCPDKSSRILPFVIYLSWFDDRGRRQRWWLFPDSVSATAWRLLRVRLTLQQSHSNGAVVGSENGVTGLR